MYYHFVARTLRNHAIFKNSKVAEWVWHRLKIRFPDALACVLMPNHLHIILRIPNTSELVVAQARLTLAHLLGRSTQLFFPELRTLWQPLPPPKGIATVEKLAREIRYVLLNPCRAKLSNDPLSWMWTTHRGFVGATTSPWVDPNSIFNCGIRLKRTNASPQNTSLHEFAKAFHQYVSADPSVSPMGSVFPTRARISSDRVMSLNEIAHAVASATERRSFFRFSHPHRNEQRRIFVLLARELGWTSPTELAKFTGASRSHVHKIFTTKDSLQARNLPELMAATMALGDQRLRQFSVPVSDEFVGEDRLPRAVGGPTL